MFRALPECVVMQGVAPADRRRVVAACLPGLLGVRDVVMARTARGKPVITRPDQAGMSVSYRDGFLALAVKDRGEIGLDLEILRGDLDFLGIAKACFAPEEVRRLAAAQGRGRAEKFFALWTAKEAVLKCRGTGITTGMASPCLPDMEPDGCAVVDGTLVAVARRSIGGCEVVTAVATSEVASK